MLLMSLLCVRFNCSKVVQSAVDMSSLHIRVSERVIGRFAKPLPETPRAHLQMPAG